MNPQDEQAADLLGLRDKIAAVEARIADLEARHAPEEQLSRARAELDALHRYDSVFTPPKPEE